MSLRITLGIAGRVLTQIIHDRRTLALMLVVPGALLALLRYVFVSRPDIFDQIGLTLLGIFPFTSMFLVTSVAMLRERTSGTLERLLSTPMHRIDLLLGYGIGFACAAVVQAGIASLVAYLLLGLTTEGSAAVVMLIVVATSILGTSVGLLTSAFARTEFQAMQFLPSIVLPQLFLCGLIWPRDEMASVLQALSNVMPLRYAAEALTEVGTYPLPTTTMWVDLAVVAGCAVLALMVGAATLRRRSV